MKALLTKGVNSAHPNILWSTTQKPNTGPGAGRKGAGLVGTGRRCNEKAHSREKTCNFFAQMIKIIVSQLLLGNPRKEEKEGFLIKISCTYFKLA